MDLFLDVSPFWYMFSNVFIVVLSLMFLKLFPRCWILPVRAQKKLGENGFSGPPPSFPLGNLNDMKKLKPALVLAAKSKSSTIINHDIHSIALPHFALWQQQYGKVFVYWLGIEPFVYVADPEFLSVMSKGVLGKSWGKPNVFKKDREPMFGTGLVMVEGDDWTRHRHIITPAFSHVNLKAMKSMMVESTTNMLDRWAMQIKSGNPEFDMENEIIGTAGEIIAKTSFGVKGENGTQVLKNLRAMQFALFNSNRYVGVPFSNILAYKQNLKASKLGEEIDGLLLSIINERKRSVVEGDDHHDLLGMLLKADKGKFTAPELVDECKTFFFAGHETTALALTWTFMLLAMHPEWQDTLRDEIRQVIGDSEIEYNKLAGLKKMGSSSSPFQNNQGLDGDEDGNEFMTQDTDHRGKRKQSDSNENSGEAEASRAKRVLPTRSDVWSHFKRHEDNRNKCTCNYCMKHFACPTKSGTTNLRNHLQSCKQFKAWEDGQKLGQSQQAIDKEGGLKSAKVSEAVFWEATNELIVLSELPLSFSESVGWKHFCNKMNLDDPQSRRTVTRKIVEMYKNRKAALKQWFKSNKQRVSLTTDIWTAKVTGCSYMVITAHYVDPHWRLKKMIIGFKYVTDHKGKTISSTLLDCLAEWGIDKVFCVTVDNATANSNGLMHFEHSFSALSDEALVMKGEFMHMRCAGHIINLIVKDGLAEVDESIVAIRNAIAYVRSGPIRQQTFEVKVDSGKMRRGSLPLDVLTRWNSTYLMLQRALKFKVAFDKMGFEDKPYNDHFLEFDKGKKRVGPPSMDDWRAVERLEKFLMIFYNSTLVVSASTTLNAHKCYSEIVNIASSLKMLCSSYDTQLKVKAEEMSMKFEKYWDGVKNINKMLIVASIFDPSRKMKFTKLCFEELYGEDSVEAKLLHDSVLTLMSDLFTEYSERNRKQAEARRGPSPSQSQSYQSSQSSEEQSTDLVEDEIGFNRIERRYNNMLKEIRVRNINELDAYLKADVEVPNLMVGTDYDVLSWWKVNSGKYPILSQIARDVFAMQVSTVASESAFSTSGRIIEPYRSCLTHFMVEVLMCMEQWLKQDLKLDSKILTITQILADVEAEDKLQREYESATHQDD